MTSSERAKDARLKKIYKSSLAEFNKKIEEQGGGCAICHKPFPRYRAFQDHLHSCCARRLKEYCGRCSRGVICFNCNKYLIGVVERMGIDPILLLTDALAYLKKWTADLIKKGCYEAKTKVKPKTPMGKK